MSKTCCLDCGKDLLGAGPGSHQPRLCIEELIRVRDAALLQLRQLMQRVSPVTEPCACPEFCTYHARSNFEALKLQNQDMRKGIEEAAGLLESESRQACYRKLMLILGTAEKRPDATKCSGKHGVGECPFHGA